MVEEGVGGGSTLAASSFKRSAMELKSYPPCGHTFGHKPVDPTACNHEVLPQNSQPADLEPAKPCTSLIHNSLHPQTETQSESELGQAEMRTVGLASARTC